MRTILLALNTWDLTLDAIGNIAVAEEPYAPAQDAASACRTFQGEVWYNALLGIPYLSQILGQPPDAQFIKSQLEAASLQVPGVTTATATLTSFVNRKLSPQVQLTFNGGASASVGTQALQELPWYVTAVSPQAAGSTLGGP